MYLTVCVADGLPCLLLAAGLNMEAVPYIHADGHSGVALKVPLALSAAVGESQVEVAGGEGKYQAGMLANFPQQCGPCAHVSN
jgi:hypothetical protein